MAKPATVGALLTRWRKTRQKSQLALATEAEVSPRHLCFVETGRAQPSREMVIRLARALDVPLRERNALLLAAGFAPVFQESPMDAPALAAVRGALDAILRHQEPFPAVVMNRRWDLLHTNAAADRFFAFLVGDRKPPGPPNVLRMMFHPDGARPFVANWAEVAEGLLRRVQREAPGGVPDDDTALLVAEILAYPGVPASWGELDAGSPSLPVLPVQFRKDGSAFDYFSTVTTLGTPQDVTAQEIRIECFFPSDDATARAAAELVADAPARRKRSGATFSAS
jgi:transcriptional regulator with XRE-family HTH domain